MSSYIKDFTSSQEEIPKFQSISFRQRQRMRRVQPIIPAGNTMLKTSSLTEPAVWNVERVSEIPPFYCLQRTHIKITKTLSKVVAERIVSAMRELSIFAIFNTEKANLRGTTWDGIEFKVNMFKSKTDDDDVLLEIHKLSGDSLSFRDIRTAIFRAAKGLPPTPEIRKKDLTLLTQSITINVLSSEEQQENINSTLKHCEVMLGSANVDTKLLGIQMLRSMTDSSHTIRDVALFTAEVIFGERNEHRKLSDKVFSFLKCYVWGENIFCTMETKYSAELSYQVLHVLTNALSLLDQEVPVCLKRILEVRADLCEELVTLLITVVGGAETRPHDAWQSAMALDVLVRNSSCAYSRAVESDAFRTLTMSRTVGEYGHRMLAVESKKALCSIGCA